MDLRLKGSRFLLDKNRKKKRKNKEKSVQLCGLTFLS